MMSDDEVMNDNAVGGTTCSWEDTSPSPPLYPYHTVGVGGGEGRRHFHAPTTL